MKNILDGLDITKYHKDLYLSIKIDAISELDELYLLIPYNKYGKECDLNEIDIFEIKEDGDINVIKAKEIDTLKDKYKIQKIYGLNWKEGIKANQDQDLTYNWMFAKNIEVDDEDDEYEVNDFTIYFTHETYVNSIKARKNQEYYNIVENSSIIVWYDRGGNIIDNSMVDKDEYAQVLEMD